jgi:hypothetical protein
MRPGKKLRRLGVPLLVASTILCGLHLAAHDPVPPLSRMGGVYLQPFYHLWFVQALLPVFTALLALESFGALATLRGFIAAASCLVVAQGLHGYMVLIRTLAPIQPVATRSAWTILIGMSAGLCGLRFLGGVPLMERIGASSYAILPPG